MAFSLMVTLKVFIHWLDNIHFSWFDVQRGYDFKDYDYYLRKKYIKDSYS